MTLNLPALPFVAEPFVVSPSAAALRLAARPYDIGVVFQVPPVRARIFLAVSTSCAISSAGILQLAALLVSLETEISCVLSPVERCLILARSDM